MTELNPVTKPLVAIIGRPNVGKSTLFNRLVGKQSAIVSDVEGTTRDRVMSGVVWDSQPFILLIPVDWLCSLKRISGFKLKHRWNWL